MIDQDRRNNATIDRDHDRDRAQPQTSYDGLMTSHDDDMSRHAVSVLGIGIVAPVVSGIAATDGIVLTLLFNVVNWELNKVYPTKNNQ